MDRESQHLTSTGLILPTVLLILGDSRTTLLETIIRLVVVILLSGLIIYLCYKLSKFRKSKRSKPICFFTLNRDQARQVSALTIGSDLGNSNSQQYQRLLYSLRPTASATLLEPQAAGGQPQSAGLSSASAGSDNQVQAQAAVNQSSGLIVNLSDYMSRSLLPTSEDLGGCPSSVYIHQPASCSSIASSVIVKPKLPCPSYEEAIGSVSRANVAATTAGRAATGQQLGPDCDVVPLQSSSPIDDGPVRALEIDGPQPPPPPIS